MLSKRQNLQHKHEELEKINEKSEKARLVFQSKESLPESLDISTLKRPRLATILDKKG